MDHVSAFNIVLVMAAAYAFVRGGVPERLAGLLLLFAAGATRLFFIVSIAPYGTVEIGILLVDVSLLVALIVLAAYADRFWPIWLAAFQALGAGAHLVKAIEPSVVSMAYAILVGVWSYPMVLILAGATLRHRRRTLHGPELDWSVR